MSLTRAQMAALLPDNTAGDISAQDMRDIVNSCLTLLEEGQAVADNTSAIEAIEAVMASKTYDFDIAGIQDTGNPVIIKSSSYVTVTEIDLAEARDIGDYELKINNSFQYNTTGRSAYFQFSSDGGTSYQPFSRKEPKDATDLLKASLDIPVRWNGGNPHFIIQAKCENSSDTLTINYASIVFERKI